ncbi:TfoX/Sxy family protein [Proteus mirabilis]|uniref:TfoX/Sxy family protein n=1 Tax=Proteus mirabilis TaxID=584 RepID=A0ABD5LWV8_PROMI
MSILPEQRKAHLLSRVAEYGKLSKKSQFGGYSLMVDEVIFAITADNEFYLKGSGFVETLYKANNMDAYVYLKKVSPLHCAIIVLRKQYGVIALSSINISILHITIVLRSF